MFSTDGSIQNLDRLGADKSDSTQRNIQNKRYANHVLENYSSTFTSDKHINFALNNLTVNFIKKKTKRIKRTNRKTRKH